ncbi:hypothetical protein BHS62_25685 [Salmonella enterica]|nr:hypothetical protein [Salmonella enterica]EAX6581931.1 hypothetical protein [Salmonella enterica]
MRFAKGWILAVWDEVYTFAMSLEERELAQRWLEQKYPDSGTTQGREAGKARDSGISHLHGYKESENAPLHHPVNEREQ